MDGFAELGLPPELVEALAAHGVEVPNNLQREAIPVLRKGHSVLLEGGPGSGAPLAGALGLLARLPEQPGTTPELLVVTPTDEEGVALALSLGPLSQSLGRRTACMSGGWAEPEEASVLVGSPQTLARAVRDARVKLQGVHAVLAVDLGRCRAGTQANPFDEILSGISREAQRVFVSLPVTEADREYLDRHSRRGLVVPSDAGDGAGAPMRARGQMEFRITARKEQELGETVASLQGDGHAHLVLFFRSDDRAADLGDLLSLQGYSIGAPGDLEAELWLGVDAMEARGAVEEANIEGTLAVLSVDVPEDADALDRRNSLGRRSVVLLSPRESRHLKKISREAGYELVPVPHRRPSRLEEDHRRTLDRIRTAITEEDLTPYLLLLEPLFREYDPTEVASALAALLRRGGDPALETGGADSRERGEPSGRGGRPPAAWVKVFLSIGERDGVGPGDLLGAITGEAGIRGPQVGRIEIRDTFSKVEVQQEFAHKVVEALNGITLRGRSVRADFDRGDRARERDSDTRKRG